MADTAVETISCVKVGRMMVLFCGCTTVQQFAMFISGTCLQRDFGVMSN